MEHLGTNGVVGILILLCVGLLCCFLGFKLQKIWIAVTTFFTGLLAAAQIMDMITDNSILIVAVSLIVAVLVAILAYKIYLVGIVLAFMALSVGTCLQLITTTWAAWAVGLVAGGILGWIGVKTNRPVLILFTGVLGGLLAGQYLISLIQLIPAVNLSNGIAGGMGLAVGAIVAIAGIYVQFKSTKDQ